MLADVSRRSDCDRRKLRDIFQRAPGSNPGDLQSGERRHYDEEIDFHFPDSLFTVLLFESKSHGSGARRCQRRRVGRRFRRSL